MWNLRNKTNEQRKNKNREDTEKKMGGCQRGGGCRGSVGWGGVRVGC